MDKNSQWISELKETVPKFLVQMKGQSQPGFFRYSLSGDLLNEQTHWGLGNTIFATKIYYTLGLLETLPSSERIDIINFIKSFQTDDGSIFDPLVARKAFWREKISSIKQRDFNNFFHAQTIRAETRQALSVLLLLGEKVSTYPNDLPKTEVEIERWLSKLDWTKPWGAGSHFSHLLFFLSHSDLETKEELIDHAIAWIKQIQHPEDGCWSKGQPTLQQKINGAMKVLTGLQVAKKSEVDYPEKLIDLALSAKNDLHACDNFNVIYVLKQANLTTDGTYRAEEIRGFAKDRIDIYREYYWPKYGGFSFYKGRANTHYYQAKISKGLPEPDIHGTVLFLWGLSVISQILKTNLPFQEFIA